jgi:DNA-binding TFAR19-related protein (PDSD5 family)
MARIICLAAVGMLVVALISNAHAPNSEAPTAKQVKDDFKQAEDGIKQLIEQLNSDDFETRERASRELADIGQPALPLLRTCLRKTESLEARSRIEKLIERISLTCKLDDLLETKVQITPNEAPFFQDEKTTVRDALNWLQTKYGFTYKVNARAFELAGGRAEDRLDLRLLEDSGPFPIADAPLHEFIQQVLRRMGGEAGSFATFLVRRDYLEITTIEMVEYEVFKGETHSMLGTTLVTVSFTKRPIEEVLEELAERGQLNLTLDAEKLKAVKTRITARFMNTPVDTAIRIVVNMADLSVYEMDNVIYVTSPERAKALEEQEERLVKKGRIKYPRSNAGRDGPMP